MIANRAVIDIGSNAIRFVAYGGAPRGPVPVYNEKAQVALGKVLAETGRLGDPDMAGAIAALDRFTALAAMMRIGTLHIVATAAVREAENGADLIGLARTRGHDVTLLSGDREAIAAGQGVLCDAPWANGYVADLGGGSLELVRVSGGQIGERVSLPFGTLRLAEMAGQIAANLRRALDAEPGFHIERGLHIHLVGGAWRALVRVAQHQAGYPLDILANYAVLPDRVAALIDATRDEAAVKALKIVPAGRVPSLHNAALLTAALVDCFAPDLLVASACGIREGVLYGALSEDQRGEDPLIVCTRTEGQRLSRFGLDGDALDRWIAPLFDGGDTRLRRAACQLADCAWSQHPEHRAEHAAALGLNGNWLGIDGRGRALLARALFAGHGGKPEKTLPGDTLASPDALAQAHRWGLAIRLAMRLDGGTGAALASTRLSVTDNAILLDLSDAARLNADAVMRRLRQLAQSFGKRAEIGVVQP